MAPVEPSWTRLFASLDDAQLKRLASACMPFVLPGRAGPELAAALEQRGLRIPAGVQVAAEMESAGFTLSQEDWDRLTEACAGASVGGLQDMTAPRRLGEEQPGAFLAASVELVRRGEKARLASVDVPTFDASDLFLVKCVGGLLALVLLGFLVSWIVGQLEHSAFEDQFGDTIAQAAARSKSTLGAPFALASKVLFCSPDVGPFDLEGLRPGGDALASVPEEVGTVVFVGEHRRKVGEYTGGGNAYRVTLDVTAVVLATGAKHQNEFIGDPPESFTVRSGPFTKPAVSQSGRAFAVKQMLEWVEQGLEAP